MTRKQQRHAQIVSRMTEINFWRRAWMLDSIQARKTLTFIE